MYRICFLCCHFFCPKHQETKILLIKLTKSMGNIPKDSPNILAQLLCETFGIEAFSLLPRYAITLSKQLTWTLNDPSPLSQIYQGIVKFRANKYGGAEHLPHLLYQVCSRLPTTRSLFILKKAPQHPSRLHRHHLSSQQFPVMERMVQKSISPHSYPNKKIQYKEIP